MADCEKNRLANTVTDRFCCFQEKLAGTKREYPAQEFLSFVEAARQYIGLADQDQPIHREVANAVTA